MKKIFFILIIFIFLYTNIHSISLKLKENLTTSNENIYLSDITIGNLNNVPNLFITNLNSKVIQLNINDIAEILFKNNIYDVVLIGENITVTKINKNNSYAVKYGKKSTPIGYLEEYLKSFIDENYFKIEIKILNTSPFINLYEPYEKFNFDLNIEDGLKDIINLDKIILTVNNNNHILKLDIKIKANVYISKITYSKKDYLSSENFIKKEIDISSLNYSDDLVYNIKKAENSLILSRISNGDILRWSKLKKLPIVKKGEYLKLVYNKNGIEIILQCLLMSDGFENERVKIKLNNGKIKYGILKTNEGSRYVESL